MLETNLTREEFKEICLKRDGYKCVLCGSKVNIHVHHIMERRLFGHPTFGYFESNGASVCPVCHIRCESTEISTEEVRAAVGIKILILPEHLYNDSEYTYDKWGNIIIPNGNRLKGELFYDESVQKILKSADKLKLFLPYVKYPRTSHLSWSEKVGKDDRIISSISAFEGQHVIVSEKSDGSNSSLYTDYFHGRSIDGKSHPSQNWVRSFWAKIKHDIPEGWRICGENMHATHTIKYENLKSFFLGFSVWDDKNTCLSWNETVEWFDLIGIVPVNILYDGIYDEQAIKNIWKAADTKNMEGYVIRVADSFSYGEFNKKVAKFVKQSFDNVHGFNTKRIEYNQLQNKHCISKIPVL